MTIPTRIQSWLQGNRLNHKEAIAIYAIAGGPYPYSHFAAYNDAPFLPDGIERQLVEIFRAYMDTVTTGILPVDPDPVATGILPVDEPAGRMPGATVEPPAIRQLRETGKRHLKKQSYYHAQLSTVETDEERYAIADTLAREIIPAVDRTYNAIREWEATGELPAIAADASMKTKLIELINKKNTVNSRISRIKSKLKKQLPPDNKAKYEKELLEKQFALLEILKELE